MKKIHLLLTAVLVFSASLYFVSCRKETAAAMLLPAIQKIRQAANTEWKVSEKSTLVLNVTLSQKIKSEFQDYDSDSNVVVMCRVKFKDEAEERLLPYAIGGLGGTKYYFYTLSGGKLNIHFVNSQVSDFSAAGTGSALPVEEVSLNFTRVQF